MRLVLLPGLDGTGDLFEEVVRAAPEGYETCVVSYPAGEPLGYVDCVDHVAARLPEGCPYVVVAESFSGPVAIALGACSPPGMKGIVLCNTFACRPAWSGLKVLPWRLAFSLPIPRLVVGAFLVGFGDAERWVKPIRDVNRKVKARVSARRMREVLAVDVRRLLAAMELPILYIRGTKDRLVRRRSLAQILDANPRVSVAEIRAPHLTLQVAATASWDAITHFVAERCEA
jgi:pimeloyl-[acyl-carrier protein] methyl ester esterase